MQGLERRWLDQFWPVNFSNSQRTIFNQVTGTKSDAEAQTAQSAGEIKNQYPSRQESHLCIQVTLHARDGPLTAVLIAAPIE